MSEKRTGETSDEHTLKTLEARAKQLTQPEFAELAEKTIRSLQQQRRLSQEELNRMVTI